MKQMYKDGDVLREEVAIEWNRKLSEMYSENRADSAVNALLSNGDERVNAISVDSVYHRFKRNKPLT
jgi:hypothetical protein